MLVKKPSGEMIYDEKYRIEERITEITKFVGPFFIEYNLLKMEYVWLSVMWTSRLV